MLRNTASNFKIVIFWGQAMPKMLEALLWCAALATWLMLLCRFIREGLRPLSKDIRRRLVALGLKAKPTGDGN